jgi:hypothetical protein
MNAGDVFINCPFSEDYQDFFRAIVFTVIRCGFNPRCAREEDDGADNRFDKICRIVGECRYGIHDISKTELDLVSRLPRFNMPLELGIFLGAKKFGLDEQKQKRVLIFDREDYRYQQFISDIGGQHIHSHNQDVTTLISKISAWLRTASQRKTIPGGLIIFADFEKFNMNLPALAGCKQLTVEELTYLDLVGLMTSWLAETGG